MGDTAASPVHGDLQTLARGGGALLFASAFGNGLNYVFGIVVARALGPTEFGLYALGLTMFNTLALVTVLGMDVGVVRFVSQHLGLGEETKARTVILQATAVSGLCGLAAGVGLFLLAEPIAVSIYQKPELATVLQFFSFAVPLAAVGAVILSALQAHQTVRYTIWIRHGWEPAGKFLLAGMLLWAGFGLAGVLTAILVSLVGSVVMGLRSAGRMARIGPGRMPPWTPEPLRALFAFCLPLIVSSFFGAVAPRSDILILGSWVRAQDVGVYLAAFQTASILALVLGAFDIAFAPMIGRALAVQDWARVEEAYQAVSRLTLLLTAPLFVCLAAFGGDILAVFGKDFASRGACLTILAAGQLFNSATGSANTILLMGGHSRMVMWNVVALGILLIGANWVLIPRFGMLGAAVAATASLTVTSVIRVWQVWALHHIHPYSWSLAKPVAAGALAAGIAFAARGALESVPVPASAVLVGAIYVAGLSMLRFERADRAVFAVMLDRFRQRAT